MTTRLLVSFSQCLFPAHTLPPKNKKKLYLFFVLSSGDGLVNSADTGIVGDTNGDGVVDANDTGIVGESRPRSCLDSAMPLAAL